MNAKNTHSGKADVFALQWYAIALVSVVWLLALGIFTPPRPFSSLVVLTVAVVLLAKSVVVTLPASHATIASILALPAIFLLDWPVFLPVIPFVLGCLLLALPAASSLRRLGSACIACSVMLAVGGVVLQLYLTQTACSHELPAAVAYVHQAILRLLGVPAVIAGNSLVFATLRQRHNLQISWENFAGPELWCFLAAAIAMLALCAFGTSGKGWGWFVDRCRRLAPVVVAWLVLWPTALIALYLHRATIADWNQPLCIMNQYLSPWMRLLGMLTLATACAVFVGLPKARPEDTPAQSPAITNPKPRTIRGVIVPASICATVVSGVLAICFLLLWQPIGKAKPGRVLFVERHSDWEPTDRPYDTEHFGHDPSYGYWLAYRYLGQYFHVGRISKQQPITPQRLSQCDVLIVKIPTEPFLPDEIDAIESFVRAGGGLLLIGDHTNVFNSTCYLNDIARRFGFTFRHDLLFAVGNPYNQHWQPRLTAHPAVAAVPPLHLAVSCSVAPHSSRGQAVLYADALWSLPPAFHTENYHPEAEYRPVMRYGRFIEAWATCYGKGRVLAFGDSTIFSNFCIFQPGKAELLHGMVNWLNRTSSLDGPVALALRYTAIAVLVVLLATLFWRFANRLSVLVLFAAVLLGHGLGLRGVAFVHQMKPPDAMHEKPLPLVIIDREVSQVPLSLGAFTQGEGAGYGLLEQWIARLGVITRRNSGKACFSGDVLVVICPTRSVPFWYRQQLIRFVKRGGRLLLIDSPTSSGTTANSLLWPFGLESVHATAQRGPVVDSDGQTLLGQALACEIRGGEPSLWVNGIPVASETRFGDGKVLAIGFGTAWTDEAMGGDWPLGPEETTLFRQDLPQDLLARYDLLFACVDALLSNRSLEATLSKWFPPRQIAPNDAANSDAVMNPNSTKDHSR